MRAYDSRWRAFYIAMFMAGVAGCTDLPSEPGNSVDNPRLAIIQEGIPPFGVERLFLEIAHDASGFGGVFIDREGVTNVVVTANADRIRTVEVLRRVLQNRRPSIDLERIRYVTGGLGFDELYAWKTRLAKDLRLSGATALSIDAAANSIRVESPNTAADIALRALVIRHAVPSTAVRIVRQLSERKTGLLTDKFVPAVPGGAGIWWNASTSWLQCTEGVTGELDGVSVLLVAAHCTGEVGVVEGTEIRQGGTSSGHSIGWEIADAAWRTQCPAGATFCRYADAALMRWQATEGRYGEFGAIATTVSRGTRYELEWSGTESTLHNMSVWDGQPFQGEIIDRVGATTGWLYGTVAQSCQDREDQAGYWFVCQTIVEGGFPEPGDSGGPAFSHMAGTNVIFAGIVRSALFSGRAPYGFAFASYDNIVSDLGPVLVHGGCTTPTCD